MGDMTHTDRLIRQGEKLKVEGSRDREVERQKHEDREAGTEE